VLGIASWFVCLTGPLLAQTTLDADSLDVVARERGGDSDAVEMTTIAARGIRGAAVTLVSGSRRLADLQGGFFGVQMRYRSVDGRRVGFLRVGGRRAAVLVGRARLRAGESVLFGRTFGGLPSASGGGSRGFEIAPTASLWSGHTLAAAEVGVRRWRVAVAAAWEESGRIRAVAPALLRPSHRLLRGTRQCLASGHGCVRGRSGPSAFERPTDGSRFGCFVCRTTRRQTLLQSTCVRRGER
jgi:hypothetical protein